MSEVAELRKEEARIARDLMAFTGKIAWPTIYLFTGSLMAFVAAIVLVVLDIIPIWIATISNTVMGYLLFTPMHEACHKNIAGKRRDLAKIESLIGWISGLVILVPKPLFQHLHNEHHKHTNNPEEDPDFWVASRNPLVIVFKCLTIFFDYLYWFVKKRNVILKEKNGARDVVLTWITLALIAVTLVATGQLFGYQYPILLWIVPAWLALGLLAFAFDWLPHHPHSIRQRYLDTRIILKPGLTALLCSQNMHLIHHLYSGIPYYHYGNAYRVMRKHLIKRGARIEE